MLSWKCSTTNIIYLSAGQNGHDVMAVGFHMWLNYVQSSENLVFTSSIYRSVFLQNKLLDTLFEQGPSVYILIIYGCCEGRSLCVLLEGVTKKLN